MLLFAEAEAASGGRGRIPGKAPVSSLEKTIDV